MKVTATINTVNDDWDEDFENVESLDKLVDNLKKVYKEDIITSLVLTVSV